MIRSMTALTLLFWSTAAMALDPMALVGTWNVTLSANYSTCSNVKVGDVLAQQWVFSSTSGGLSVAVLGAGVTSAAYTGSIVDGGVGLKASEYSVLTTVDLTGDGATLAGRRVVAKTVPCAIIYDVAAKKQ
jgi:hypothetical protein